MRAATTTSRQRHAVRWLGSGLLGLASLLLCSPASAAQGNIDHVQDARGGLEVLYSIPDAGDAKLDLGSLAVSLDKAPLEATATLASDSARAVRRVTVLAIDTSRSMRVGGKFTEAKRAADVFLDSAPADVRVGIVTFAGGVTVAQEPSFDRIQSRKVIESLTLSAGTRLYDAVEEAVKTTGKTGGRSVLVISDGRDTTTSKLTDVVPRVRASGVKVDVVTLARSPADERLLTQLTTGGGTVVAADDPAAMSQVFADEAKSLADQILVSVTTTPEQAGRAGTLSVAIDAGGQTYTDNAFVTLPDSNAPAGAAMAAAQLPVAISSTPAIPRPFMIGGLVALTGGLLVIVMMLFGFMKPAPDNVSAHIDAYTQGGKKRAIAAERAAPQSMTKQAVGIAERALESNQGMEVRVGDRLEAAGMSLKPAEWLLLHAGIAVGAAAVGFLLSAGSLLVTFLALAAGVVLPWMHLGRKRSKRVRAFNGQLAETLQLMAGSLQAGLSMVQSIDTVVREGMEPLAGEFRRAIIETRLGVQIEDALDSVADRMESADFKWTVMAIRIQRDVGGNLAELLISVAATLRERDYLRRQVKSLSAEGRFSAYILLALPPAVLGFMMLTNREYVAPLVSTPRGLVMLGAMCMLMGLGYFTMSRMIKVDV